MDIVPIGANGANGDADEKDEIKTTEKMKQIKEDSDRIFISSL